MHHYCIINYHLNSFQIWQCEFISEHLNPRKRKMFKVRFIQIAFRWNDESPLFSKYYHENTTHTVGNIYDKYQDALAEVKRTTTDEINVADAGQMQAAQWHLEEYLKLSNSRYCADTMRSLYRYDDFARWDSSWKTYVYKYCHIGDNELCLISSYIEDLPGAVWKDDVLVWDYFGKVHYYYKTQETALTALNSTVE